MSTVHVVVGGQFGSEAKGHVTAQLAARIEPAAVVRVAGPNAGHTAVDPNTGNKIALRQIPCAAVVDRQCDLLIAAGSEVDPEVLLEEIDLLEGMGIPVLRRLWVDPQATLLLPKHRGQEWGGGLQGRIGSTAKGIGAARADRIMRTANLWADVKDLAGGPSVPAEVREINVGPVLERALQGSDVIIEGTQGYGLGLHAGYYPYCTSSDARAVDFLAMVGISPWSPGIDVEVYPVFRTFPIRVAGNSGPLLGETTWEALGEETGGHIQVEHTTVTQKPRRVGKWDAALAAAAMRANGGPAEGVVKPVLTFFDYWFPEVAGTTSYQDFSDEALGALDKVESDLGQELFAVTTGPDTIVWFD